jgi:hypothetical protein
MRVRTIHPHFSADGACHALDDEYELEGLALALRLKDGIVADAAIARPDPAPTRRSSIIETVSVLSPRTSGAT